VRQPGRRVPRRTRRPAAQRPPTLRRAEPDSRADGRNTPRLVSRKRCQALTTNPGEDPHSRHAGRPPYCSIRADSAALYGQTRQRTPYPGPPPKPACTGRPGWTAQVLARACTRRRISSNPEHWPGSNNQESVRRASSSPGHRATARDRGAGHRMRRVDRRRPALAAKPG
jgi:hypothetical protein